MSAITRNRELSQLGSFIYIDDIVRMIVNSVNLSGSFGPVNLAGASSYSIKSLVQLIIEISGKPLDITYHSNATQKRDLLFDTTLMNQLFGKEKYTLVQGIKNEYSYFSELINKQ